MRRLPALTLGLALAVHPVLASGFALPEQGAEAAALGGAWVARADDASANWYNPAALARVKGTQVQVGASAFRLGGRTDFSSGDSAWGLDPASPRAFDATGESLTAVHLYFSQAIGERWAWGLGVNRPFGFATEWRDRPVTFSSERAELGTYRAAVNVAWAINDTWSVGGGVGYVRANLSALSREVAVNLDNDPSTIEDVGRSHLSGSGSDVAVDLSALYATRGFSAALVYRSGASPRLDGNLTFSNFAQAQTLFPSTPARVDLELPAELVGGVAWGAADTWQFELDVSWMQWSRFADLRIDAVEETPPFVEDTRLRQDWEDTIGYHLGASWDFAEGHEARLGVVQDQGAVPEDTRRPAISDLDRVGVSVGYGYAGAAWSVDTYAMALFFADSTANGDPGEGVLDGRYGSSSLSVGATVTRRF